MLHHSRKYFMSAILVFSYCSVMSSPAKEVVAKVPVLMWCLINYSCTFMGMMWKDISHISIVIFQKWNGKTLTFIKLLSVMLRLINGGGFLPWLPLWIFIENVFQISLCCGKCYICTQHGSEAILNIVKTPKYPNEDAAENDHFSQS